MNKEEYIEVLRLAKQNSDNFEYCLQGLEKEVEELKEKLKPFEDVYFRGLTNEAIAELAKKSFRLTAENSELMHKLEQIKDLTDEAIEKRKEVYLSDFKKYFDEEFIGNLEKIIKEA